MKTKWLLHLRYFIAWVLIFIAGKAIFMLYHSDKAENLSLTEIFKIFGYGLRLDLSFAGYLCALPFLALLVHALFPRLNPTRFIKYYTWLFLFLVGLLTIIDLELYQAWGFRLDATPLQYLSTPAEMMASAGNAPVVILLLLFVIFLVIGFYLAGLFFKGAPRLPRRDFLYLAACLFYAAFLIVPIRGGLQHIPINQSDVYFSEKAFANHAAVNVPWNVLYAISKKNYDQKNPYQFFPDSVAQQLVLKLYPPQDSVAVTPILKTQRPNILFIILESYTAKLVGSLGGEPGVTPNLDKLAQEGILFTNMYASGNRSEKGLVALLSGYPVQTTTSIIKTPRKTEKLPHLNKILQGQGYRSSYYYGGELAFANIKSYLLNAGYDRLVSKFDFAAKDYNSKWGVHDHVLFNRVLQDLKNEDTPFFSTIFTLSSHEPYDVPIPAKFNGTDETTQFKNSVYYTDYALGQFIAQAKKEPWWNNTLVVLVADHGHRLPGDEAIDKPSMFRIPFILTGGALTQKGKTITQIGSQTDIVPTLLAQLNLSTHQFHWSKNLLSPQAKDFAFYVFHDGFGFITPQGAITFDNVAKKVLQRDAGVTDKQLDYGKAYLQHSFSDYLKK